MKGLENGEYNQINVPWCPEDKDNVKNPIMQLLLRQREEMDPFNNAFWSKANFLDR